MTLRFEGITLNSLVFSPILPTLVPGAFCSFYARRACSSSLWAWSWRGHEAPTARSCFQQSLSRLFLRPLQLSSSTRVFCSLSRPQVPSYVRRVSLLVRNRLGTVDSLLNFHFPNSLALLGF